MIRSPAIAQYVPTRKTLHALTQCLALDPQAHSNRYLRSATRDNLHAQDPSRACAMSGLILDPQAHSNRYLRSATRDNLHAQDPSRAFAMLGLMYCHFKNNTSCFDFQQKIHCLNFWFVIYFAIIWYQFAYLGQQLFWCFRRIKIDTIHSTFQTIIANQWESCRIWGVYIYIFDGSHVKQLRSLHHSLLHHVSDFFHRSPKPCLVSSELTSWTGIAFVLTLSFIKLKGSCWCDF